MPRDPGADVAVRDTGDPATTVTGPDAFGAPAVVGISLDYAREDHDHGLPAAPVVPAPADTVTGPDAYGDPAAAGIAATYSRSDHDHGLPAAPPGTAFDAPSLTLGVANAAGASGKVLATDSTVAAFDAVAPVTQAFGDAAATGAATVAARRDHKHGMPANPAPAFAAPGLTLGLANAAGASGNVLATDSTIAAFDATVPVTQAFGDVAATGAASVAARRDHTHGMPATPTQGLVHYVKSIVFNTANLNNGVDLTWVPKNGDLVLAVFFEITTIWNGTTPKGDVYVGDATTGLFRTYSAGAATFAMDGSSNLTPVGSTRTSKVPEATNEPSFFPFVKTATPFGNWVFVNADQTSAQVCVSQTGLKGGTSPGATQGAAVVHVIVLPAAAQS